jgi:hypothetical protein
VGFQASKPLTQQPYDGRPVHRPVECVYRAFALKSISKNFARLLNYVFEQMYDDGSPMERR